MLMAMMVRAGLECQWIQPSAGQAVPSGGINDVYNGVPVL